MEPNDTWQVVNEKLERASILIQWLKKNGMKKEFITTQSIQHYEEVVTELEQIFIFLRGLNND